MRERVSVVIPTYNYGHFIAATIQSVLNQTHRATEIIVVDDGSNDDTREVVAGFDQAVTYIRQDRAGVCAARNRGAQESKGEFIAFLDADDLMEPAALEKQLTRFRNGTDLGLVHCGLRLFDSDTDETIRYELEGGEEEVARNLLLWEGPVIAGPGAIVIRREVFDAVGGFDTSMKVGEDWDFCYRVAQKFGVGFVPEPLVHYRSHAAAAHRDVVEMERGMLRFYEKAFSTDDESVLKLRRRAYGNFHKVMAGSYFRDGNYRQFLRHAARSILMSWRNLGYFLKFPLRRLTSARDQFARSPDSDE